MQPIELSAAVADVIRRRKTEKVLGDVDTAAPVPADIAARNRALVLEAIKSAGWAPFHYPRNVDRLAEPWRAHVVWDAGARRVARHLRDELGTTTKEPSLAAACSALVLVTWLPESEAAPSDPAKATPAHLRARDEEHLAAAAAMVQNLLLLLTAHGMGTYWSSGGKLRDPAMFRFLSIPDNERLLAAVFVEYPEMRDEARQRVAGKLRDSRSDGWVREVEL